MNPLVALLLATCVLFYMLAVVWVLDRRQERRRRLRDLAFQLHVAEAMARHAMVRPKSDRRIQRRRYAR